MWVFWGFLGEFGFGCGFFGLNFGGFLGILGLGVDFGNFLGCFWLERA